MEAKKGVVDRLADLARCKTGRATAFAFIVGSPAWSHCVRVREHDGDCVMGLSKMEQDKLSGVDDRWFGYLKSHGELLLKRRLAGAAYGT
jgi:hypothetical protein